MPPIALGVAEPSDNPLQLMFELTTDDAANAVGCVMVTLDVLVHELASVIVTVYVPADTPVIAAVVAALLHVYVYGDVPPIALAVAPPSDKPLQLTLAFTVAVADRIAGAVIVTLPVDTQPNESVVVTVYVPAITFNKLSLVVPFDQLYELIVTGGVRDVITTNPLPVFAPESCFTKEVDVYEVAAYFSNGPVNPPQKDEFVKGPSEPTPPA